MAVTSQYFMTVLSIVFPNEKEPDLIVLTEVKSLLILEKSYLETKLIL